MEQPILSSNWKALHKTLKSTQDPTSSSGPSNGTAAKRNEKSQVTPLRGFSLKRKASNISPPSKKPRLESHGLRAQVYEKKKASMNGRTAAAATPNGHELSGAKETSRSSDTRSQAVSDAHSLVRSSSASSTSTAHPGKYIAIDCEMVGTTSLTPFSIRANNRVDNSTNQPSHPHPPVEYSILARVSLISYTSETVYDKYVLPPPDVHVTDYRTPWSGITPWHLSPSNPDTAPIPFEQAQKEVAAFLDDRVLVGHAIKNDLDVLGLSHPQRDIRDTAKHPKYRALTAMPGRNGKMGKTRAPGLKMLAEKVLGWDIQNGGKRGHDSVEDARATMELFRMDKAGFEEENARNFGRITQLRGRMAGGQGESDNGDDEKNETGDDDTGERKARKKKKKKKKLK